MRSGAACLFVFNVDCGGLTGLIGGRSVLSGSITLKMLEPVQLLCCRSLRSLMQPVPPQPKWTTPTEINGTTTRTCLNAA